MQTERRERELERQISDLEKQKRDVQLKLWRDLLDLRQDLSKERQEYRATRAGVILGDWRPDSHIAVEDYSTLGRKIAGQIATLQRLAGR